MRKTWQITFLILAVMLMFGGLHAQTPKLKTQQTTNTDGFNMPQFMKELQEKYKPFMEDIVDIKCVADLKRMSGNWYINPEKDTKTHFKYELRYKAKGEEEYTPLPVNGKMSKKIDAPTQGLFDNAGVYIEYLRNTLLTLRHYPDEVRYLGKRAYKHGPSPGVAVHMYEYTVTLEASEQGIGVYWFSLFGKRFGPQTKFGYTGQFWVEDKTQNIRWFSIRSSPNSKQWQKRLFDWYTFELYLDPVLIAGTKTTQLLPVLAIEECKFQESIQIDHTQTAFDEYKKFGTKVEIKDDVVEMPPLNFKVVFQRP